MNTLPKVMGILNVAPNSFSVVGRHSSVTAALAYAEKIVKDGADMIDVGAEATNPGLYPCISLQEELDRLLPIVERLTKEISVPISIDTSKPQVIKEVAKLGVNFINDVRALREEGALLAVAELNMRVCLMHMAFPAGRPSPDAKIVTDDIVKTVKDFLKERIAACEALGISKERIVIDPGIGHGNFGKDLNQNLVLLKRLEEFKTLGCVILVGVSRKTFIGELLDLAADDRLAGSIAAAVLAVAKGADIVRVHDVKETVHALRVATAIWQS